MKIVVEVPVIVYGDIGRKQGKTIFTSVPRAYEIEEFDGADVRPVVSFSRFESSYPQAVRNLRAETLERRNYIAAGERLAYLTDVDVSDGQTVRPEYPRHLSNGCNHPFFGHIFREMDKLVTSNSKNNSRWLKSELLPIELTQMLDWRVQAGSELKSFPLIPLSELQVKLPDYGQENLQRRLQAFDKLMSRMIVASGKIAVTCQEPIVALTTTSPNTHEYQMLERRIPKKSFLAELENMIYHGNYGQRLISMSDFDPSCLDDPQSRMNFVDIEIHDPSFFKASSPVISALRNAEIARRRYISSLARFPSSATDETTTDNMLKSISIEEFILLKDLEAALHIAGETDLSDSFLETVDKISRLPISDKSLNNQAMQKAYENIAEAEAEEISLPHTGFGIR